MSRFLDKLERIWAGKAQPLGFGPQTSKAKSPAMAIVARLSPGKPDVAALTGEEDADALLVPIDDLERAAETLSRVSKAAGDIPFGISVAAVTKDDVEQLIELSQTKTIGQAILYMNKYVDGKRALKEIILKLLTDIEKNGLDILSNKKAGHFTQFRKLDLAFAINRLDELKIV